MLWSIKYRDKSYKELYNTDRSSHLYLPLNQKWNTYKSLINKSDARIKNEVLQFQAWRK